MKFQACFNELEKHAGLGDALKRLALTEIPGTKPWMIGKAQTAVRHTGKALGPKSGTFTKAVSSGTSGARAYDVSELARKMGV